MAYVKTTWVNDSPPDINAENLNKMEQGIYDAHQSIDVNVGSLAPAETSPTTSAHANLDYITYNGHLYQVVVAMEAGTTLEPGVNIIETTVADALDDKQNTLTFDNTPTEGSTNPVTSGGIATKLSEINTNLSQKANASDVATALANQEYFYIDSEGYGCINYDLFQTA